MSDILTKGEKREAVLISKFLVTSIFTTKRYPMRVTAYALALVVMFLRDTQQYDLIDAINVQIAHNLKPEKMQ